MRVLFLFLFSSIGLLLSAQPNYNLNLVGSKSYTQDLNDIWGWRSASGTEYALVGTTTGTSLVSLANPTNPTEVQFIPGAQSIWRDLKTFGNYCYVTCDQGKDGLLIIDLSTLPNSVSFIKWRPVLTVNGDTDTLNTAHNLYIDENGICYIAGSNINEGEPFFLDLNTNPWNPTLVGATPAIYAHDVYARGDTLWTSDIYDGVFSGYNVSNKANPVLLGSHPTPMSFTHNAWISDDGNTLFTTDERANAWIGSYDVSDMNNIKELDRWRPAETEGTGVIPHNVHVLNDFVIISFYTDGIVVIDGQRPANLVEVGKYDTYPQSGTGFFGCWGAYPYFSSGLIAAADINNGLFLFQPNYQRACWLEGNITDSLSSAALSNVTVSIVATPVSDNSAINGDYKTGYGISGTYDVTYTRPGYQSKTISTVLQNGILTVQDVQLIPLTAFSFSGQVVDANNGNVGIPNAVVYLESDFYNHSVTADVNGNFTIPSMFQDNYSIYAGKWGYKTVEISQIISQNSSTPIIPLNRGYRDEFALDLGWTVVSTCVTGAWERAVPELILFNGQAAIPDGDLSFDIGTKCYLTGANNNGSLFADDVDGGITILRSPVMDLSGFIDPYVSYYAHFIDLEGFPNPNDSMIVRISNGTQTTVLSIYNNTVFNWRYENLRISDYITLTNNMRMEVEVFDKSPGHIVEASFDLFEIVDSGTVSIITFTDENNQFNIYPNPFSTQISVDVYSVELLGSQIRIFDSLGRLVKTQLINEIGPINIQMSHDIAPGLYIVNIAAKSFKIQKL